MLSSTAAGLLAAVVAGGGQAPPALADGSLDPHGLLLVHAEGRRVLEAADETSWAGRRRLDVHVQRAEEVVLTLTGMGEWWRNERVGGDLTPASPSLGDGTDGRVFTHGRDGGEADKAEKACGVDG